VGGIRGVSAPSILFPTYIEPFVAPRWWERDTTSPAPDGAVPQGMHSRCATHVKYALTCRQFDRLLARSRGRCEACGASAGQERFGVLSIDHEHGLGRWAVRGMLCNVCNTALHPRSAVLPTFSEYLQRSFYLTLLAESSISDLSPIEPPLGTVVLDHGGYPWRREHDYFPGIRWYPRHCRHPQSPESWEWLVKRSGPHKLTVYADVA
jgi:hypothetical protein